VGELILSQFPQHDPTTLSISAQTFLVELPSNCPIDVAPAHLLRNVLFCSILLYAHIHGSPILAVQSFLLNGISDKLNI